MEAITLENEEENEIIQTYGLLDKDSEAFLIRDGVWPGLGPVRFLLPLPRPR